MPPGICKLVLCVHDESTLQANDGEKAGWGPKVEQPLLKKGAGCGSHQSDIICSTFGWLKDAGQQLEYGKNYDGYWTGELFVKQLREKIIQAFEAKHDPPKYQALIMVDNSQGHSAYAADALRVSLMNLGPGGANIPLMQDGWFIRDGEKIIQSMLMPDNHPSDAGNAKGIKQALLERGLWRSGMLLLCRPKKGQSAEEGKCHPESSNCYATRTLSLQPDFLEQKSLVQETIEELRHLCIFLPKYFIEFF